MSLSEKMRCRGVSSCLCNIVTIGFFFPQSLFSSKGQGREMAEWAKQFFYKVEDQSSDP